MQNPLGSCVKYLHLYLSVQWQIHALINTTVLDYREVYQPMKYVHNIWIPTCLNTFHTPKLPKIVYTLLFHIRKSSKLHKGSTLYEKCKYKKGKSDFPCVVDVGSVQKVNLRITLCVLNVDWRFLHLCNEWWLQMWQWSNI